MPRWTEEKIEELKAMLEGGATVKSCADHFDRHRATIHEAIRMHLPHLARSQEQENQKIRQAKKETSERNRTDLRAAQKNAFSNKAANAKRDKKWDFTVTMEDLVWPTHCPVLGIELDWFSPRKSENSPSFDRIDPSKGYVPGNVAIISWRANRIKNDGSAEEHRRIAEWMCN